MLGLTFSDSVSVNDRFFCIVLDDFCEVLADIYFPRK